MNCSRQSSIRKAASPLVCRGMRTRAPPHIILVSICRMYIICWFVYANSGCLHATADSVVHRGHTNMYMYVCIYIYMYVCIYIYIHVYIYIYIYIYIHIYVCIYVCMSRGRAPGRLPRLLPWVPGCLSLYIYIYIYTCIYIYIYMYMYYLLFKFVLFINT